MRIIQEGSWIDLSVLILWLGSSGLREANDVLLLLALKVVHWLGVLIDLTGLRRLMLSSWLFLAVLLGVPGLLLALSHDGALIKVVLRDVAIAQILHLLIV